MTKIGVALSGGGVAGCAHLGVLKALEESGIEISAIAGTSSGAMVAALYAYGFSVDSLIDLVPAITNKYLDVDYPGFLSQLWKKKIQGLFKGEKIQRLIATKTKKAAMSELPFPAAILSTDLRKARKVIFSSQPLAKSCPDSDVITDIPVADAVRSSCSIPFLFKPVLYEDKVLVDGGILDNCPVSALHALGVDKVIAVNLVSAFPIDSPFDSCFSVLARAVSISLGNQVKHATKEADVILQPETNSIGMFEFSKSQVCVQLGYEYTVKQIDQIKNMTR
jgi:NTE family protein